jgi:hypothetical protein
MPRYQCHKIVQAAKITRVAEMQAIPSYALYIDVPIPEGWESVYVRVSTEWQQKHGAQAGGYFVRYEDGYESFSPAVAFESGYTRLP